VALADTIETYLRVSHVPDVLATGCFAGAYRGRLDPFTFRTTYVAHDQAALDEYFARHTARMRAEFVSHFPAGVTLDPRGVDRGRAPEAGRSERGPFSAPWP
jgi:hypothetical protein